jgi:hypothetical protein
VHLINRKVKEISPLPQSEELPLPELRAEKLGIFRGAFAPAAKNKNIRNFTLYCDCVVLAEWNMNNQPRVFVTFNTTGISPCSNHSTESHLQKMM